MAKKVLRVEIDLPDDSEGLEGQSLKVKLNDDEERTGRVLSIEDSPEEGSKLEGLRKWCGWLKDSKAFSEGAVEYQRKVRYGE